MAPHAARLLELCAVGQLPPTITGFLGEIYQRYPKSKRKLADADEAPSDDPAAEPEEAAFAAGDVLFLSFPTGNLMGSMTAGNEKIHASDFVRQALLDQKIQRACRQRVVETRFDCDGDTILLLVDQLGGACHTGRRSCFYNAIKDERVEVISAPIQLPMHQNKK